MKYIFIILFVFILSYPVQTYSREADGFAAGVIFGEPIGPTVKYFFRQDIAVDLGVSYSFGEYMVFYSDCLWHFRDVLGRINRELSNVKPYMGGGLGFEVSTRDKPHSGDSRADMFMRIPLGLEWTPSLPIGVFAELAPGMELAPKVDVVIQGGVGIRYYF